jgi:hypothetical protein
MNVSQSEDPQPRIGTIKTGAKASKQDEIATYVCTYMRTNQDYLREALKEQHQKLKLETAP